MSCGAVLVLVVIYQRHLAGIKVVHIFGPASAEQFILSDGFGAHVVVVIFASISVQVALAHRGLWSVAALAYRRLRAFLIHDSDGDL